MKYLLTVALCLVCAIAAAQSRYSLYYGNNNTGFSGTQSECNREIDRRVENTRRQQQGGNRDNLSGTLASRYAENTRKHYRLVPYTGGGSSPSSSSSSSSSSSYDPHKTILQNVGQQMVSAMITESANLLVDWIFGRQSGEDAQASLRREAEYRRQMAEEAAGLRASLKGYAGEGLQVKSLSGEGAPKLALQGPTTSPGGLQVKKTATIDTGSGITRAREYARDEGADRMIGFGTDQVDKYLENKRIGEEEIDGKKIEGKSIGEWMDENVVDSHGMWDDVIQSGAAPLIKGTISVVRGNSIRGEVRNRAGEFAKSLAQKGIPDRIGTAKTKPLLSYIDFFNEKTNQVTGNISKFALSNMTAKDIADYNHNVEMILMGASMDAADIVRESF